MRSVCPLCLVAEGDSKHHLVPKSKKGKETVLICTACHKQIHVIFSNKDLEKRYSTIEDLKADANIRKWVKWRNKHPSVHVRHKQKK